MYIKILCDECFPISVLSDKSEKAIDVNESIRFYYWTLFIIFLPSILFYPIDSFLNLKLLELIRILSLFDNYGIL